MNELQPAPAALDHCWRAIGSWGDQSCPELKPWIHCQNCPVLGKAGLGLFDQAAPTGYLAEWGRLLATEEEEVLKATESIFVFRIRSEWVALAASIFQSIEEPQIVHRIPHRSNKILLGLANIRGALQLCISLGDLLDLAAPSAEQAQHTAPKLGFVEKAGQRWVFPIDEVLGVHRYTPGELQPSPVTIAKSSAPFVKGLLLVDARTVGLLDDELLFHHLKRSAIA
jgi:chemotaxis-related protein WspD